MKSWRVDYREVSCIKICQTWNRRLVPCLRSLDLLNIFVIIVKCISPNGQIYLSKLQNIFVFLKICQKRKTGGWCLACSHLTYEIYLSLLWNVFVPIVKYICQNCKIHLSEWKFAKTQNRRLVPCLQSLDLYPYKPTIGRQLQLWRMLLSNVIVKVACNEMFSSAVVPQFQSVTDEDMCCPVDLYWIISKQTRWSAI